MKYKQKLFLSYLIIISIFSIFLASYMYVFFQKKNTDEWINAAEKTFLQTSTVLNNELKRYFHASYIVETSAEVKEAMSVSRELIIDSPGKQLALTTRISEAIYRAILPLSDIDMKVFVDDAYQYMGKHINVEFVSALESQNWYSGFRDSGDTVTWKKFEHKNAQTGEEYEVLSLFRKMGREYSVDWISELYIKQTDVQKMLSQASLSEEGIVFLQTQEDTMLSATDESLCSEYLSMADTYLKGQMNWDKTVLKGREYFVFSRPLTSVNWYLTLLLPVNTDFIEMSDIVLSGILLFGGILATSLIAAWFFVSGFSRRLLLLEKKMALVCTGEFNVSMPIKGKDEISHLMHCFNTMVREMNCLSEQRCENAIRIKTAELNALQEQINPHFLYNTLELIKWKAMESDAPDIAQISHELSDFYRISLSNGKSMIPFREELNLVSHYIEIQNFRFSQEIMIILDVSEECFELMIPKLTLQPLIENAVLHGFLREEDDKEKSNIIRIQAKCEEEEFVITVTDNGVGMHAGQVQMILSENREKKKRGYGLWNVQQRIQLLYGNEYGLAYKSAKGEGTTVTIRLKVR